MPDKKLTEPVGNTNRLNDTEIKKALECCSTYHDVSSCKNCPLDGKCEPNLLEQYALDLINRLQAKAIKEQNKNSKLRNERNRLQAQNKELAETIHNLTLEKDALFDKAEELKAEVERLTVLADLGNMRANDYRAMRDKCKTAKAEAYKEFADKIKADAEWICDDTYIEDALIEYVDDLVKELVGEDK